MDQTWLENILVRRHSDETPAKVLDLKVTQAVGKGENYLSLVKKINATILLLSGGKRNICLIVKDSHQNPEMKKMTTRGGFFEREITMYRDILPKMEDLIHSMDHPIEPLWPKCYSFTLYDQLVFEDLTARGYKMIDRKLQQDLAHSRLVFTKLGQLHSLSKIILDRFEIPQGNFKNMWCQPGITSNVIERSIAGLGKEIASWGDEWKEILARFDEAKSSFYSRLVEALTPKPSDFLVLNHGDCWSNNMLFKNDEETGHPISMKFIDFQISNIGSPINDLHYFVATSVQPEIYKNHSDELLRTYCDSLKANLTELKYEGTVPGFEELKHKMDDTRIAQFCFGICLTPVIIADKGDVPDLENVVEDGSKKPEINGYDNLNDRSRTYLKNLIKEATDSDLI